MSYPSRTDPKQGGFEPDPTPLPCRDPGHDAPTHLYVPAGQQYRHICPSCGFEVILKSSGASLDSSLKPWRIPQVESSFVYEDTAECRAQMDAAGDRHRATSIAQLKRLNES